MSIDDPAGQKRPPTEAALLAFLVQDDRQRWPRHCTFSNANIAAAILTGAILRGSGITRERCRIRPAIRHSRPAGSSARAVITFACRPRGHICASQFWGTTGPRRADLNYHAQKSRAPDCSEARPYRRAGYIRPSRHQSLCRHSGLAGVND